MNTNEETSAGLVGPLSHWRETPANTNLPRKRRFSWQAFFYIVFNTIGIFLYLRFASQIWAPPEEKGLYGGPGDPIIWVVFAFPFLFFASIVNVIILVWTFVRGILYRKWLAVFVVVGAISCWFAAFEYDNSRQFDGSWLQDN